MKLELKGTPRTGASDVGQQRVELVRGQARKLGVLQNGKLVLVERAQLFTLRLATWPADMPFTPWSTVNS